MQSRSLHSVTFSPIDGAFVWASSKDGLLYSRDGGREFHRVESWVNEQASGPGRVNWILPDPTHLHSAFVHTPTQARGGRLHHVDLVRGTHEVRQVEWSIVEPSPATPELWYVGLEGEPTPMP